MLRLLGRCGEHMNLIARSVRRMVVDFDGARVVVGRRGVLPRVVVLSFVSRGCCLLQH